MKALLGYGTKARWLALGMTALIWACGGGGGGSDPTPQPVAPTAPPPPPPPAPTDPLGEVQDEETEQFRLFAAMADDVFGPAYAGFDQAVRNLQTDIATFCSNLGSAQVSEVQEGWREAMLAWQRAEPARFGPIDDGTHNLRLRIQFFPDHNDAVPDGVDRLLDDGQPLTEARIANSSVGAQGLPAIEYLLFALEGFDSSQTGMRRCDLLQAVGANLATMAFDLATTWSETGAYYPDFVNASGSFDDRFDVLIAIIESAAVQTEYMGDRKLRDALSNDYMSLESWRSKHSRENLLENFEALDALFENGDDYGFADYLERVHDADDLVTRIEEQMGIATNGLNNLGDSLEDVLLGDTVADVDEIHLAIQRLADLFVESAAAAGVTLGFNNMDGD